jgi:hypothetical protein
MAARLWYGMVDEVRYHGPELLGHYDEPHTELLSLVWGPKFDRQQARSLLTVLPVQCPVLTEAMKHAADCFDALDAPQQQRLRHLIVRHQRRCHNFPCHEFS